jgi:hypothetical protein
MIVLRALKFEEIRRHIATLLAPGGKVVLYRTEVVQNHEVDDDFYLVTEKTLILPRGAGKRVISVIEKFNS